MKIGAIVLAAGRSKRFGSDKRKAVLPNGKWIIQQTLETVLGVFDDVLVVLRENDEAFEQELVSLMNTETLVTFRSPDSDQGMGHNLANAVRQITEWEGVYVFLADMPYLKRETLEELKSELNSDIVIPTYEEQRGHPIGFPQRFFQDLASLSGDKGAREILIRHESDTVRIPIDDSSIIRDVDKPSDLEPS